MLESLCDTCGYGRFSLFGSDPVDWLETATGGPRGAAPDAFDLLASRWRPIPAANPPPLPFYGGWVGYLPYEMGAEREGIRRADPPNEAATPMRWGLYDTVAAFDHGQGCWYVAAVDLPGSALPASRRLDWISALLTSAPPQPTQTVSDTRNAPLTTPPQSNMSKADYCRKVRRAIAHIAAGDIYQVNLTQRFTALTDADPLQMYLRLRQVNPADFAAFLPWDDQIVISASPELFLSLRGRTVTTRPIKGTRARAAQPDLDARLRAELAASPKDRAELNMIIDLLRNDLGRVCEFGSIGVRSAAELEAHPTVWHLVSTIVGQLHPAATPVDLLRAAFPGGSVTGCPKIRAMQIIRNLEPTPRGVYCGAIGYLGLNGDLSLNVAIRTMLYDRRSHPGRLHLYAGGAITADSTPEAEYAETLAKAAGMFRALGHPHYCPDGDSPAPDVALAIAQEQRIP